MSLTKALIDVNVCLDALLNRKPFFIPALKLIEGSQMDKFDGVVAGHSFDTIFYLLNRSKGKEKTYKGIKIIREAYGVVPVNQRIIDEAINDKWNDFEDAIHYQAARAAGCDAIITRNKKDFGESNLPLFTPQAFLDQLNEQ